MKYKVWPMLEFSWAVDDHLLGITHILRGKDLVIEDMVEEFIWEKLGWKKAEFVHYGLLAIKEAKLSKTQARRAIERGEYSGWDDPRTWSLQSLRRRGIQPEAIRRFVIKMGLSLADVIVPAEILYAENRKLIDPIAKRFFVVFEPQEIEVENAPRVEEIELPLHPDFPEMGKRKIKVNSKKIYVEKEDLKRYKGKKVGLIGLFTVEMGKKVRFVSRKIEMEAQKIHWVSEPFIRVRVIMPDGSVKSCIGEPDMVKLKEGEIIQMQRIGFARVDEKKEGEIILCFAHK